MKRCRGRYEVMVSAEGVLTLPQGLRDRFTYGALAGPGGYGESIALQPARPARLTGALPLRGGAGIALPETLRRFAGKGILAGMGTHFELWPEAQWRRMLEGPPGDTVDPEVLARRLAELDL